MEHLPDSDAPNMVRCDVTDELVPEDETVVLQGKRVSARGKQILLDQLRTGHSIGGEIEAPGSLRRFGCALIDGLLVFVVAFAAGFIMAVAAATSFELEVRLTGLVEVAVTIAAMMYFALMHARTGQTLGKMAGKIKVVNLDGSDIDFKTALLRAFMFNGIQGISGLVLLIGGAAVAVLYGVLDLVVMVYGLANAITVLATPDKRAIHDFVAGTRVIMLDN